MSRTAIKIVATALLVSTVSIASANPGGNGQGWFNRRVPPQAQQPAPQRPRSRPRPQVSVPEPATLALLGSSLLGLGLAARRRRK